MATSRTTPKQTPHAEPMAKFTNFCVYVIVQDTPRVRIYKICDTLPKGKCHVLCRHHKKLIQHLSENLSPKEISTSLLQTLVASYGSGLLTHCGLLSVLCINS